jgi:hypothetical protein
LWPCPNPSVHPIWIYHPSSDDSWLQYTLIYHKQIISPCSKPTESPCFMANPRLSHYFATHLPTSWLLPHPPAAFLSRGRTVPTDTPRWRPHLHVGTRQEPMLKATTKKSVVIHQSFGVEIHR